MNQLTIRGFEPELAARIRRLAQHEGISLNKAVLRLLRRGAGLAEPGALPNVVGGALDEFIGTWSDEEADAMIAAVDEAFEQLDEEMWR